MVLFLTPLAKIAAGLAIAYGAWTIWKSEWLPQKDIVKLVDADVTVIHLIAQTVQMMYAHNVNVRMQKRD